MAFKKKKGTKPKPPVVRKAQARNNIDPAIVRRRRKDVNRLRADGFNLREIADTLLDEHISKGSTLFTFVGPDRQPVDQSKLSYDELRDRVYSVVQRDAKENRDEAQAEQPDATRLADDRYLLAERLRMLYKRLLLRMEGDPTRNPPILGEQDNGKYNQMARTAIDLSARIGRLQGIETEKPMELRLPERYRAWIDDEGIIHKEKMDADGVSQNEPEQKPN